MHIPAGSIVTCLGGHELYRLMETVTPESTLSAKQFAPIHPKAILPVYGEPIIADCPECGQRWCQRREYANGTASVDIHFAHGWADDVWQDDATDCANEQPAVPSAGHSTKGAP